MKQIILLIMISFSVQLASAQGIIFSSGDFDDIVKQAKEQKKVSSWMFTPPGVDHVK